MTDDMFLETFLEEADELIIKWEESVLALDANYNIDDLNGLFRIVHTLKGSSKAVNLNEFGDFIHHTEDAIKKLLDGEIDQAESLRNFLNWQNIAAEWIQAIHNRENFSYDQKQFKQDLNALLTNSEAAPTKEIRPAQSKKADSSPAPKQSSKDDMIRVSATKCDKLLRSVGQITINCAAMRRVLNEDRLDKQTLMEYLNSLEKHADVLHKDTIAVRMQPLDRFFLRMQRLAKDVSSQTGKPVKVATEGSSVEIDKSIADRLIDPFVHIVRNAIDHGIEEPETRFNNGKSREGSLTLSARNMSSGVEISVSDDGKGLDPKVILRKAVEKNIVEESANLSTAEINQLILKPGFSTKEEVTDLSGRGVGMDVVASTLKSLGGKIDIISEKGSGTTFRLFIPANLTILDAFVVESGSDRFCVLVTVDS